MTESQYTQAIHKIINSNVLVWKINAAFAKGVADAYYSGDKTDLWVEYKYLQSIPKNGIIVPNLSKLQQKWLTSQKKRGRNVAVIVGTPLGGYLLHEPMEWLNGFITNSHTALSKREIAEWIENFTSQGDHYHERSKTQQPATG